MCRLLARAAGSAGMAGGQAIDLASVGVALTEDQLRQMHRLKTGALLQASVLMGAACGERAEAGAAGVVQALTRYGAAMGLAFQVVDDILDVTADSATLGKTAGKDAAAGQADLCVAAGAGPGAGAMRRQLLAQALAALDASGLDHAQTAGACGRLADMVVQSGKIASARE